VPAGGEIGANDVADEVLPRLPNRRFRNRHALIAFASPRLAVLPAARPD
jgi:hypothetical protein